MLAYLQHNRQILFGDDLNDVAAFLQTPRMWVRQDSRNNSATDQWDLRTGYDKAAQMMRDGWSEGAQNLSHDLDGLPVPTTTHAEYRYDVAGHFPDVPRFTAGMPDHMVSRGKRIGQPPVVHIVFDGCASFMVHANDLRNFGLAIAAMVDKLEAQNNRVELDVVFSTLAKGVHMTVGWKVKQARDHMDLSAVAFSLGHPAAFRRIGFAMFERCVARAEQSNYGMPTPMTAADLPVLSAEGALLIPGIQQAMGACSTKQGALKFVVQQVNRAAGEELIKLEEAA